MKQTFLSTFFLIAISLGFPLYAKNPCDSFENKLDIATCKEAEQGDAEAQFNIGLMYLRVEGYETAVNWFRKAAEQGHEKAQYNLATAYIYGKGVEQSYETAAKWYNKAAEQGVANAMFNLGILYYKGQGVKKSRTNALKWFKKADKAGHPKAKEAIKRLK